MKMEQESYIVIFITTRNAEEAEKISEMLVKRRLAACVNSVAEVSSHFWWKDKLEYSKECLLIVKTREKLFQDIVKAVKKIHSYSIPEIIAMPIINANEEYLEWLDSEVI